VKVIQAASWLAADAGRTFKLGEEELAIACGSHHGDENHVRAVSSWLERLGLDESHLECGVHPPYDKQSARNLIRSDRKPCPLHNNCSGKHCGLLTFCRARGWDTAGYSNYDHPVQVALRETLAEFYGLDAQGLSWGIDGCGIPTYAVDLATLAKAMARVASPGSLPRAVGDAVGVLTSAIAAKPHYIGGTESFCTKVVAETEGRVFAKLGAEGVYCAWLPQQGLGLAMKAEDGHGRATEVAMASVLRELGHPLNFFSPLVRRWTGEVVGQFVCA
jgi:L-asparaginase II